MDFFVQVSKELDQQVASLVKTITRRAITPIQTSDEAQLQQLVATLSTITQTARDSFVWRCGLVTVCADDPGALTPGSVSLNTTTTTTSSSSNDNSDGNNVPAPDGGIAANDRSDPRHRQHQPQRQPQQQPKITPLDSRISVIARLTDLLSLVYVAHTYFTKGSEHELVFKRSQSVTLLAVVAGACDVPFLPLPLCASILETLNACLQDFLGVVHAEHSVNNAIRFARGSHAALSSFPIYDRRKFPRKLPLTFSVHAHRYLLKSLSRRIFQPLYASWLISALGSPESLTPFPGSSNNTASGSLRNNSKSSSANAHPTTSSSSIANPFSSASFFPATTATKSNVGGAVRPLTPDGGDSFFHRHDGSNDDDSDDNNEGFVDDESKALQKAQTGMNFHSCFLKDAVVRIICGGFLGDGPAASPHSYVAVALNILSIVLLTPLDDPSPLQQQQQPQPQQQDHNRDLQKNASTISDAATTATSSTTFDRRASQIFGARSVDGMATICEALIRRTIFSSSSSRKSPQVNIANQGNAAAASILNASPTSARRLCRFFWAVRPLIQSLSTCPLTRKSFMDAESTRNLFDLLWKTIAAMIDVIDSTLSANSSSSSAFDQIQNQYQNQHKDTRNNNYTNTNHNNNNTKTVTIVTSNEDSAILSVADDTNNAATATTSLLPNNITTQRLLIQQKLLQAVIVMCFSVLPLAINLWKCVCVSNNSTSSNNNNNNNNNTSNMSNNRGFSDTIFIFARKASLILVPPPMLCSSSSSYYSYSPAKFLQPTSQELIVAFDSLVHAVEFAASVETTPSLKDWLREASSEICSIHTTSPSPSSSSSSPSSNAYFHIQSQWSTLLVTLGIDDTILRCVFASTIGRSPECDLPPHLSNLLMMMMSTQHHEQELHQQQQQHQRPSPSSSSTTTATMNQSRIVSASTSSTMMMVVVDTALRDSVSHDGEKEPTSKATPDMIFGALAAVSGSPLYNNNNNYSNDGSSNQHAPWLPNPIMRRALLKMASLAADDVSCRDVCRVLLRSSQSICPISWVPVMGAGGGSLGSGVFLEHPTNNNGSNGNTDNNNQTSMMMLSNRNGGGTGFSLNQDDALTSGSRQAANANASSSSFSYDNNNNNSNGNNNSLNRSASYNNNNNNINNSTENSISFREDGLSASLRIELAQQKSLNFDLERELQKRSNEASVQDAKIRALHETINSMESDCNQQRAASATMREMLDSERQQKQQVMNSESNLRSELNQMALRLRELEAERHSFQNQARAKIEEAERRANSFQGQLQGMERELHSTREKLSVSEDRVNKFVALHNTFSEMSKGV